MRQAVGAVMLLMAMSLAAAAIGAAQPAVPDDPLFEMPDPAGDLHPATLVTGSLPTPSPPQQTATDLADLSALRVLDEDFETLVLGLSVQGMQGTGHETDYAHDYDYGIEFRIDGYPVQYSITWGFLGANMALAGSEAREIFGNFCVQNQEDTNYPFCRYQEVTIFIDPPNERFLVEIPKHSLLGDRPLGDYPPPSGTPDTLRAGARLVDINAYAIQRGFPGPYVSLVFQVVYLQDDLPNAGETAPPYAMNSPTANTELVVHGPRHEETGETLDVAVQAGRAHAVPITVENRLDAKRLVNLTVRTDGDAAGWSAEIAPGIEVPAGEHRQVTLLVEASEDLDHMDSVRLHVKAVSIGHEDEVGGTTISVYATVPPGPDNPVLHFHAVASNSPAADQGVCFVACAPGDVWVNTLDDDPRGTADSEGYRSPTRINFPTLASYIEFATIAESDTPLPGAIHFDPDRPITVDTSFSSRFEHDATIQAWLDLYVEEPCQFGGICITTEQIAAGQTTATIGTSPTASTFTFFMNPDYAEVSPEDGRLAVTLAVSTEDPRASTVSTPTDVIFYAAESRVTLPLIPDPAGHDGGPLLVGLYPASDLEEFVNPGKTRLFYAILVNEDVTKQRFELAATASDAGWTTDLKPGTKYELAPGQSVNTTILVTAPGDADEGERVNITVSANTLNQTDAKRNLTFQAVATNGIDIADQADDYVEDPDEAGKVFSEPVEQSPGLPVLAILAAAAAGVVALRRPRRG